MCCWCAPANARIAQSEEVLTADREAEVKAAETKRTASAPAAFDLRLPDTKRARIEAEWIDVAGMAQQIVEERSRRADFWSSGSPHRRSTAQAGKPCAPVGWLPTGQPMLMVPAAATKHRVAIA
jgi:hypothetical protein